MKLRRIGVVIVSAIALSAQSPAPLERWSDYLPQENTSPETTPYASSRVCKSCHPSEYESWSGSYHRTMTQWASPDAIVPEWEGVDFGYQGRSYRLLKRGENYFVDMPRHGTAGTRPEDRLELPVLMTTGSHQMQYYWMPVPWANPGAPAEGEQEYVRECASCHHEETSAGALEGAFLGPNALRDLWSPLSTHGERLAHIGDRDRRQIAAYVERIQFPGRLVQFPFVYFMRDQRWLHDSYTFLRPEEAHSSIEPYGKHWNGNCDDCHSTAAEYFWDEEASLGQTRIAELGIACEACHGAGRSHVERFRNPVSRYRAHLAAAAPDDIVNPAKLGGPESASVCARCHAELVPKSEVALPGPRAGRPGERIEASAHVLQLERPPYPDWLEEVLEDEPDRFRNTFWADGTIRIAGRDYNGLVKSACFQSGELSCVSCHTMHGDDPKDQLRVDATGDAACLRCHEGISNSIEAHTHHPVSSLASRCYSCHMPHTTWGLLGAIRAHRIDIPSVETSLETGRPNACNLCHLDRSLGDMAASMTRWYGQPELEIPKPYQDVAASIYWLLSGDAVQRATIAWHMGYPPAKQASGDDWQSAYLAELLDDPYAAVRYAAYESLTGYSGFEDLRYRSEWPSFQRQRIAREVRVRFRPQGELERPRLLIRNGALDAATILELKALRDDSRIFVAE